MVAPGVAPFIKKSRTMCDYNILQKPRGYTRLFFLKSSNTRTISMIKMKMTIFIHQKFTFVNSH
jgi:hypothetical protein